MSKVTVPPTKRPRTPSSSSSSLTPSESPGSLGSAKPPHKASRIVPASRSSYTRSTVSSAGSESTVTGHPALTNSVAMSHPILCNLPPTCHRQPTPIANTNDLERHYATYHAHVCEVKKCGCVFPEARLLELHQAECHDPLAALRKDRGEKIFQCHIPSPTCGRNFLTPKARRLHLIQAHSFPKEYFFAVTNKGVGGLLKKWGEGASLVRRQWKPREGNGKQDMGNHRDTEDGVMNEDEDDDDDEEAEEDEADGVPKQNYEDEPADLEATPRVRPTHIYSSHSDTNTTSTARTEDNSGVAGLTDSLNSLTLVPNAVRFGRGGKSGGFIPNSQFRGGHRGAGRGNPHPRPGGGAIGGIQPMEIDGYRGGTGGGGGALMGPGVAGSYEGMPRGRGRARGRGRGRGSGRGA